MRGWLIPVVLLAAACSSNDRSGPGTPVDSPNSLSSTTLDRAIALTWSDNPFASDPDVFQNYRIYSTSYDIDNNQCGTWRLEGTGRRGGKRRMIRQDESDRGRPQQQARDRCLGERGPGV